MSRVIWFPLYALWLIYVVMPMRLLGMDTATPPPWRYLVWRLHKGG